MASSQEQTGDFVGENLGWHHHKESNCPHDMNSALQNMHEHADLDVSDDESEGSSELNSVDTDVDTGKGFVWHCQIYPDDFKDPKSCLPSGELKPRRPFPHARATEFFGALVQTEDGRWIYPGELNGWPALVGLEVRHVNAKVRAKRRLGLKRIKRYWSASKDSATRPSFPEHMPSVRVTLRAPSWTTQGWSPETKGFIMWGARQKDGGIKLHVGEDIIKAAQNGTFSDQEAQVQPVNTKLVKAIHIAHRYHKKKEGPKDKVTYHAVVVMEWDHGEFCTLAELAWLNTLGATHGQSNWFDDCNEENNTLYTAIQRACGGLQSPWKNDQAEIRVWDMPFPIEGIKDYMTKYTGVRFADVHYVASGEARLCHRSQVDIMRYLINYMRRYTEYHEEYRNCQTFAADFYGFVCGKKHTEPYHPVCRVLYKNRSHMFLYEPEMFNV